MVTIVSRDDLYVLNYSTKYLARDNTDARHNYGQYNSSDPRARIAEAWRFPIVDSYYDGQSYEASHAMNCITFIFAGEAPAPDSVALLGTFANLHTPIPLRRVDGSKYWTVSVAVPKGEVHRYKFLVDGRAILDPVNPQRMVTTEGHEWSRFFTQYCTEIISFEDWEAALLQRLTDHILPFRTTEGQRFLDLYYNYLDRQSKDTQYARTYRLDQPVGAVGFIDKIVAREEAHRLVDYKICLELIDRLLRQRNPYQEPGRISTTFYAELYDQMAAAAPSRAGTTRATAIRASSCNSSGATPTPALSRIRSTAASRRGGLGLPGGQPPRPADRGAAAGGAAGRLLRLGPRPREAARPQSRISRLTEAAMAQQDHFDVVIVGSGAGGAPIAHTLVSAEKSVLMIEKGPLFRPQGDDPFGLSDYKRDELISDGPEKILTIPGLANTGASFYTSHIEPDLNDEPHIYRNSDSHDYATIEGYTCQCVGGGTQHYGGVSLRFTPLDFRLKTFNKAARPAHDLTPR